MQNTKVYPLVGLIMVLATLLANHIIGRLPVPKPHPVPIENFPRQVGEWHGGADQSVDASVQKVLSTARIVTRTYTDSHGDAVELLLLTASDYKDFHDPNVCFPGQGWTLTNQRTVDIDGQTFNSMIAVQGATQLAVLYWMPEDSLAKTGQNWGKMMAIRKLAGTENTTSLFVRLTMPIQGGHQEAMLAFARACKPYLDALNSAKR